MGGGFRSTENLQVLAVLNPPKNAARKELSKKKLSIGEYGGGGYKSTVGEKTKCWRQWRGSS